MNCTILYKQAVPSQCLFCSNSQNDGDSIKSHGNDDSKKKQQVEKPVDLQKKSRYNKLKFSRTKKGENTLLELLLGNKVESVNERRKNKRSKDLGHKNVTDKLDELHWSTTEDSTVMRIDKLNQPLRKSEVVQASEVPSKEKSRINVMKLLKEAAVELGGDIETTKEELLSAFKSVRGMSYDPIPREKRDFHDLTEAPEANKKPIGALDRIWITGNKKLGIFTKKMHHKLPQSELKTWQRLRQKSLLDSVISVPTNYFEELILWTYHGKLWHFPIDNEQGMDTERNTDFTEHIFLEEHLEPWCPKTGPLRHFMELVTVGLSKNPYLSVMQKKEHILWYKDYFDKKKKLLNEIGAFDSETANESETN